MESNHVLGIFSPAHTPSLPKLLTYVAPDGIEPPLADPESAALPLCDRASLRRLKYFYENRQTLGIIQASLASALAEGDFEPLRRCRLPVFKTGAIDQLCQTSNVVTRERLELPTPTFVASCSDPTELTSQSAEAEGFEPSEPFGSAR